MKHKYTQILYALDRREALSLLGGLGASMLLGGSAAISGQAQSTLNCVLTPDLTEGPYFVDEKLNRSDIRIDPATGAARPGTLFNLTLNVYSVGSSCAPLTGAYVDVWHADASGNYSDEGALRTSGQKYLRGYQITDGNGSVTFTTIYPGMVHGPRRAHSFQNPDVLRHAVARHVHESVLLRRFDHGCRIHAGAIFVATESRYAKWE